MQRLYDAPFGGGDHAGEGATTGAPRFPSEPAPGDQAGADAPSGMRMPLVNASAATDVRTTIKAASPSAAK